ncbi:uncharacterized protein FFB14_07182 [Fusarium fujikuroi]|nr:uncharacterized protein FFB14_07182 [Fusarium fujikuroi]
MSLLLTPTKMEAWLRLNGKSSAGQLALYGSSVLGLLLTLYWAGLVIYHIYFYSLASYLGPLLAISTPTEIFTSAYKVTHDENYFPDPSQFDLNRWLSNSAQKANQPLSLGAKACLGPKSLYPVLQSADCFSHTFVT